MSSQELPRKAAAKFWQMSETGRVRGRGAAHLPPTPCTLTFTRSLEDQQEVAMVTQQTNHDLSLFRESGVANIREP